MEFQRYLCFFLVFFSCLLCSSLANKFYVGGRDGWVSNPSESFSHWAGRNRFQVNDSLFFKYKKGSDSVLVVNKDDYYNCNKKNPVKKLQEGDSEFKFDRSGPFFFISGKDSNCEKGQKLIVNVLAVKRQSHHNPKAPAPAPMISHAPPPHGSTTSPAPTTLPPKSQSPVAPVGGPVASPYPKTPYPAPALPPMSPVPVAKPPAYSSGPAPWSYGPSTGTPTISPLVPAISPSISLPPAADTPTVSPLVPAISPSISLPPGAESPTISPLVPAISPSISLPPGSETPELSPTTSPSLAPSSTSPSPSEFSSPPAPPPESTSPSPSESTTPPVSPSGQTTARTPSGAPSGTPSGTIKAPSPSQSSAWVVTPSSLLLGSVTLVLSVAIGSTITMGVF